MTQHTFNKSLRQLAAGVMTGLIGLTANFTAAAA